MTIDVSPPATINQAITALVQQAPAFDHAIADQLVIDLRATAGDGQALALAIARVVELVVEQLVDAGTALPALAMACATLTDRGFGKREFEMARYEIETLLPLPGTGGIRLVVPDVPLTRLKRRS